MKKNLINFILLSLSIGFPLIIADLIMKSLYLPKQQARVMLLSKDGLSEDLEYKITKFSPLKEYRHVAVYGGGIEFDYTFKTNHLGFRNTFSCNLNKSNNLKKNNYDVVITGDSFTEGTGSNFSWTKFLEKEICKKDLNTINTAIPGYGIEGMANTLAYAKKEFNSKYAILALIPDDIHREHTRPFKNEKYSYTLGNASGNKFVWWHIDNDLSAGEINKIADKKVKAGLIPVLVKISDSLKYRISKAKYIFNKYTKKVEQRNFPNSNLENSVKYINKSIKEYGKDNFLLIILPTKEKLEINVDEFYVSRINNDLAYFLKSIDQEISIADLRNCDLSLSDFYKIDGHPNERGYKKIGNCSLKSKTITKFVDKLE